MRYDRGVPHGNGSAENPASSMGTYGAKSADAVMSSCVRDMRSDCGLHDGNSNAEKLWYSIATIA